MKRKLIWGLVFLLLVAGMGFIYINEQHKKEWKEIEQTLQSPKVYQGISVGDVDISGLLPEDAKKKILEAIQKTLNQKVILQYPDKKEEKTLAELGLEAQWEDAFEEAISLGRSGEERDRYEEIQKVKDRGKNFPLVFRVNPKKMEAYIASLNESFGDKPENASIEFDENTYHIIPGKNGYSLNEEKLIQDLQKAVEAKKETTILVEGEMTEPEIRTEDLERINGVIGTYTSDLGNGTKGRNLNIALSAKRISNRILWPGEELSFNEEMGDITVANGYYMASTIQNGQYIDSLGGGLCQTSTTLYNALIRGDVEILERHPHSIPAPYVPIGEDGAVWVGTKDLRFRNNWDFPILIMSSIANNKITFTIYGDIHTKDYDVEIYSVVTEKIECGRQERPNEDLLMGETKVIKKGRNGYRAQTFKVYKKDGAVIKKVPYLKSYYPKQDWIVDVGTKELPPQEEKPETVDIFAD
ncbi:MAG: VanW family protein [Tissierellia bacterium]|nr:VanW family protein [Tissierellia bacterium]